MSSQSPRQWYNWPVIHPSLWPMFREPDFGVKGDVPWETTQLNVTEDYLFDYTYIDVDDPPKFIPFEFEVFDWKGWGVFATINWYLPFIVGAVYLALIFGLQRYLKNRKALNLKWPLFLWNASLGIFSIIGFSRTFPEFFYVLTGENGMYKSICFREGGNYPLAFWSLIFGISKYIELGDTVFIVLRKRPLIFIQWYHHLVTMISCWLAGPYVEAIARWYIVMNYGVHSMMYPYFAAKAVGCRVPRSISIFITTCQLAQMLTGLGVNMITGFLIQAGVPCYRHPFSIQLSALIYGSFTILFGKLFYDTVVVDKKNKQLENKSD